MAVCNCTATQDRSGTGLYKPISVSRTEQESIYNKREERYKNKKAKAGAMCSQESPLRLDSAMAL